MRFMDNPFDSKISDLFEEHAEELDEFGLGRVPERINHEGYDGFIPYTNGGWRCMIMDDLSRVWGSGSTYAEEPQKVIRQGIDYSLDCAIESFIEEYHAALRALYGFGDKEALKEVVNYHNLYERGESGLAEKLSEHENTSLSEGGEFWVEFRAHYYAADNNRNETGEDEICFIAGVNTDFEYGRDSGLQVTYERTFTVAELANLDLAEIVQDMHNSVEG